MKCLVILAGLLAAAGAGAGIFAFAGLYNVAATVPHTPPVHWLLTVAKQQSIKFHASGLKAPALDDAARLQRGFRHYETGCATCHGAPGSVESVVGQNLNPAAPGLALKAARLAARELFWVVKHGIKMTGMPAWEAQRRDDEVWDVVAFLEKLPGISAEEYARLAAEGVEQGTRPLPLGPMIVAAGPPGRSEAACIRCHGMDGSGHASGAFPRLTGQNADYLYRQLKAYAAGSRPSGFMAPVARVLSDAEMRAVADYYAAAQAGGQASARPSVQSLQQGGALAAAGDPARRIPACLSCHGDTAAARLPGGPAPALAGQYAGYMAQQLRLWKDGIRDDDPGRVMAPIARAMTAAEIAATAAYFAALAPAPHPARAASGGAGDARQ